MDALTYVFETGACRAGTKHGVWEQWSLPNGQPWIRRRTPWVNGEQHGLETLYIRGWTWGHIAWANGRRHGPARYYSKRIPGGIAESRTYVDDKAHGGFRWEGQRVRRAGTEVAETTGWIKMDEDKGVMEYYDADFILERRVDMR